MHAHIHDCPFIDFLNFVEINWCHAAAIFNFVVQCSSPIPNPNWKITHHVFSAAATSSSSSLQGFSIQRGSNPAKLVFSILSFFTIFFDFFNNKSFIDDFNIGWQLQDCYSVSNE